MLSVFIDHIKSFNQLDILVLFLEIVQSELICKEKKRSLEMVEDQHLSGIYNILDMFKIHALTQPSYDAHVKAVHSYSCVILVLQSVLEYFELKLTYSTYNYFVVLVPVYLDSSLLSQLIDSLLAAGETMDPASLFETSHAVKGNCGNLGLTRLSEAASRISEEFRPGNPRTMTDGEVKAQLDEIAALYGKTAEEIRRYAAENP